MNQFLNRSTLPPYLIDQFYQESKCPKLKLTLEHINSLMSEQYLDDSELMQFTNQFMASEKIGIHYERVIRDAKQQFEMENHAHSKIPICYHKNTSLKNRQINPRILHMPHEDYEIIMVEGDNTNLYGTAKIVYDSIGYVRQFYKEKLNIHKMFGCDTHINAVIHFGEAYSNAFWNSQAIYLGDGDQVFFNPFYNEIDIIAHELAHGLITFTTKFRYFEQSGALDESIADIIGIMVKQYINNQRVDESNWLIGENLFINKSAAKAIRSMSQPGTAYYFSPKANDKQIGHMKDYTPLPLDNENDNGGVHIYSGIPNRAFYLLASELGGYSWEIAGQIWIQTLFDQRLTPRTNFHQFAKINIETAQNLFGKNIAKIAQRSWKEVGIYIQ